MTDAPRPDSTPPFSPPPAAPALIVTCLSALAVMVAVAGTLAGLLWLVAAREAGEVNATIAMKIAGLFLGAWSLAAALWALGALIAQLHRFAGQVWGRTHAPGPGAADAAEGIAAISRDSALRQDLRDILAELEALREDLLLPEDQRQARLAELRQESLRALAAEAQKALAGGQADQAAEKVRDLADRAADQDSWQPVLVKLRAGLDSLRQRHFEEQAAGVEEMMAAAAFDRALLAAEELAGRYPSLPAAAEFRSRVARESATFQAEQRRRLFEEITRHVEAKSWRQALAAAQRLMNAHPQSPEALTVLPQIVTLEENARIEEVRGLRDEIRRLIDRRGYAAAAEVAEDLIRRFPDTRAAAELREQLPRLTELARGKDPRA